MTEHASDHRATAALERLNHARIREPLSEQLNRLTEVAAKVAAAIPAGLQREATAIACDLDEVGYAGGSSLRNDLWEEGWRMRMSPSSRRLTRLLALMHTALLMLRRARFAAHWQAFRELVCVAVYRVASVPPVEVSASSEILPEASVRPPVVMLRTAAPSNGPPAWVSRTHAYSQFGVGMPAT